MRKGYLYERAGLADYWVLNLINRTLEVYREPVADAEAPFGWSYARREDTRGLSRGADRVGCRGGPPALTFDMVSTER